MHAPASCLAIVISNEAPSVGDASIVHEPRGTTSGSRPMARIGGELVMQGDTLVETPSGIVVTLVHVDRGSVTIRASDPALDLSGQWQRSVGR